MPYFGHMMIYISINVCITPISNGISTHYINIPSLNIYHVLSNANQVKNLRGNNHLLEDRALVLGINMLAPITTLKHY